MADLPTGASWWHDIEWALLIASGLLALVVYAALQRWYHAKDKWRTRRNAGRSTADDDVRRRDPPQP